MANTDRTYGQWCPIAVGLDVIGDRWALLICRELLLDDQRFTDLRVALPGLAPSLLTARLRALEAAGMVEVVELPPPAARSVYRMTEHGRSVAPVLRSLARFGVQHLDGEPTDAMDARRVANAMLSPWRQRIDVRARIRVDLGRAGRPGGDAVDVVVDGLSTRFEAVDAAVPADVAISTTPADLLAARRDRDAPLVARIEGEPAAVDQALRAFALRR